MGWMSDKMNFWSQSAWVLYKTVIVYKKKVHISCSIHFSLTSTKSVWWSAVSQREGRNRANQVVLSNPVIAQKSVQFLFPGSTAGKSTDVIWGVFYRILMSLISLISGFLPLQPIHWITLFMRKPAMCLEDKESDFSLGWRAWSQLSFQFAKCFCIFFQMLQVNKNTWFILPSTFPLHFELLCFLEKLNSSYFTHNSSNYFL